ncbi:hypothetical protein [Raineyella sp. W15-4]|uniref:hypothetical protein n=1 Tax=Raineyella sp. W15-4 TaxID=3081651 RepID=UPI002953B804|nr:hypothetical protein [Raineyella sp. W15-4]WOQ17117.1 hypothetical protein R0145_18265 [Raineyella sp. W15-4]
MSRTDAHVPLRIRVARGDIGRAEVHDHADGVCDLPDPFDRDALWQGRGHCHWEWRWDGHAVCSCWMCHGGYGLRLDRRADRQRTRRELRTVTERWNYGDDAECD